MKSFIHLPNSIFIMLFLLITSCSTPMKELIYLNDIETGVTHNNGPKPDQYRIQPSDQLFIEVISNDPANAAFLNLINTQQGGHGTMGNTPLSMELITYLVDEEGMIVYPQLGKMKVGGLHIGEVLENIQHEVDKYLESTSVFVKLINRTVTILGEVHSPGQILMVKNQLTIFETIGAAGDITDWGNRRNVKVIRELPEGKHFESLDLTDPQIIYSPYYYILPHDVVYVEHNTKVYGAKNLPYATPISIGVSIVTLGLLLLNVLK